MKSCVLTIVVLLSICISTNAAYDYVVTNGQYIGDFTLNDHKTMLMTGGGGHYIDLEFYSKTTIKNTDPLVNQFSGGIWQLTMADYARLDFSGGEIHTFDILGEAKVTFSGGRIDEIWCDQQVPWIWVGDPPVHVLDKHIEIVCRDHHWDPVTHYLSGTWDVDNNNDGQLDTFNIKLVDMSNAPPVIDNIKFTYVPEPVSLLLLGLGGLLLRRRRV